MNILYIMVGPLCYKPPGLSSTEFLSVYGVFPCGIVTLLCVLGVTSSVTAKVDADMHLPNFTLSSQFSCV